MGYAWELKLTVVVAVFCLFKACPASPLVLGASRALFVAGHALLYWGMASFNQSIVRKASWPKEKKDKARSKIQIDLVRPLILRGLVVAFIHWRFALNPPPASLSHNGMV